MELLYTAFMVCHFPAAIGIDVRTALKVMEATLAQELMDKELYCLHDQGIHFNERYQCPDTYAVSMDEGHILKNIKQRLHNGIKERQGYVIGEAEEMEIDGGDGAAASGMDDNDGSSGQVGQPEDLNQAPIATKGVGGVLKSSELRSVMDAKLLFNVLEDLVTTYDAMPPSQQQEFLIKPRALQVILGGFTDNQNTATARALLGSPEVIEACKKAGHQDLAVCLTALLEGALAWDMPGLTSAERTTLLANRSAVAWRILGPYPFLAMPMPQSIRGFSSMALVVGRPFCA